MRSNEELDIAVKPFRLTAIVAESNLRYALERAAERLNEDAFAVRLETYEAVDIKPSGPWRRSLEEADCAILSMINTEKETALLADALKRRTGATLAFTCQPELMLATRFAGFDAALLADEERLRRLAREIQKNGAPLPPIAHVILAAAPRVEPFLPDATDEHRGLRQYARAAQYWMSPSVDNLTQLIRHAAANVLGDESAAAPPVVYPAWAMWHPELGSPVESVDEYMAWRQSHFARKYGRSPKANVGLIFFRQFVLSANTDHYRAVVEALERQGLGVIGGFANLDNTPLLESAFKQAGAQAIVNLTGFNLVGSMGRPDPDAAVRLLEETDVPYLVASPLLFQSLDEWKRDPRGIVPAQVGIQVVAPELEGGAEPRIYGGKEQSGLFRPDPAQVDRLARRVRRWVDLRAKPPSERKVAIVLFRFPPDKGAVGTAAYLDVFRSLFHLLRAMKARGYAVDPPRTWEALAAMFAESPISARLDAEAVIDLIPFHRRVEKAWGPAPGMLDVDGETLNIHGVSFGNVWVGIQPSFGYEGDPMRLLLAKEAAPSYSFSAFYAWINRRLRADAVIHWGTHGALEFMPGKQVGLSADCYPDALIDDLPHAYFYSVNNPSEATIAKRRSSAIIVSHLSPPLSQAGLYKDLAALRESLEAFFDRAASDGRGADAAWDSVLSLVQRLNLEQETKPIPVDPDLDEKLEHAAALNDYLIALEQRLIPIGLYVAGEPLERESLLCYLAAEAKQERPHLGVPSALRWVDDASVEAVVEALLSDGAEAARKVAADSGGAAPDEREWRRWVDHMESHRRRLLELDELKGVLQALDGRFVPPSPGGDPVRSPEVIPTGRNMHALDPYRIPSRVAIQVANQTVDMLLQRELERAGTYPVSVGVVLWGTDNIKNQGEGVAQALRLLGVEPMEDTLGRMTRLRLIPLEELGRPRIDVVMTASGIFRDIFGVTVNLIQDAVELAASADEPPEMNYVRRRSLELKSTKRIFSNASGAYGTGVNHLVDQSEWETKDQLAAVFLARKGHALSEDGAESDSDLLEQALKSVSVTLQNVDSSEIGLADVDHYYEYLGGLNAAVEVVRGEKAASYVSDTLGPKPQVRALEQEVAMEARAKLLNPKWHGAMLRHGYQGVHEIAIRFDNAFGWSATSDAVSDWVYQEAANTFAFDEELQEQMRRLNPGAYQRIVGRLLEADARGFWSPSQHDREALQRLHQSLEAAIEGIPTM